MTEYRLPPGMTAKNLRFIADDLRSHNFVVFASTLGSWADAIDPPSESVVTDEVVDAVARECNHVYDGHVRDVLEAVERLGWLDGALVHSALMDELERMGADPGLCWDEALGVIAERLEMAERLLRLATLGVEDRSDAGYWWGRAAEGAVTADEFEYLRSLDGEGE